MEPHVRKLCSVCWGVCGFASTRQNLDMATSKRGLTSFVHPKRLLAASAQCRVCNYLVDRIKWHTKTINLDVDIAINVRFHKFENLSKSWLTVDTLEIRTKFDGENFPWEGTPSGTQWSVLAHRDDPAATEIQWSPVNYNVSSSAEQAKSWIQKCRFHKSCPEPAVPLLPTRILDVSHPEVRLHISEDERYHYCALSYSWGGPQPVRTLAENIESHRAGIRCSDLPQTIQDAIYYTRQLGIDYLWIDSLCIVQDSVEDKTREIARMASIYQNALVTIAATNSSRCTDGFLSKRAQPSREICIEGLPWSCGDGSLGKISLHWQFWYHADQEPLNQRAWTLQERLLSPRVLSFGSQQLIWECQTTRYTDGGDPGHAYDMGTNRLESYIFSPSTAAVAERSPQAILIHYTWTDTVMDLSRRKISEESDKLPAISGIARQMYLTTGDTYFAGLWRASLHFELMWLQDASAKEFQHAIRPTTYRAPSWSWASVEGTIAFSGPFKEEDLVAKVIQCEVCPVDQSNPFGAVSDGRLVIRGPLRSLGANLIPDYFDINSTDRQEDSLAKLYLDGDEVLPSSTTVSLSEDVSSSSQVHEHIWLLDMARNKHGDPSGYALRQVFQQKSRLFRRIGWYETTTRCRGIAFWTQYIPMETITIA